MGIEQYVGLYRVKYSWIRSGYDNEPTNKSSGKWNFQIYSSQVLTLTRLHIIELIIQFLGLIANIFPTEICTHNILFFLKFLGDLIQI